ncbi:LysR family transcriptional regulator [Nonomuraea montanisoli]|uniref:LysR family transcriptional regulator n=1 Tax=Nonomuraea montanisoli TaxID=2741721 RepID=UPI001F2127EE|nr:LysR substrate-binding domain-containing protein [Nonomuraea montanisoli]
MTDTNTLDTATLRLFDEVARNGSITAAAELLGYTQSAVSRRVAALERAAGGPLFERLARGVRLTPAGRALHRHAVAVLDRLERAGEELSAIHGGSGGTLRVGAFATANVDMVPGTLRHFSRVRPRVEPRVIEGLTSRLVERLQAGSLDIAVISDYPAGLPAGFTPRAYAPEDLVPEAPTPEGRVPEDSAPADRVPEDRALAGRVPEDLARTGRVPGEAAPREPRPGEASSGKGASGKGASRRGDPEDGPGRAVLLREDRLLVALPREHPLAREDTVDLRDLAGEAWIEAAPRGQPTLLTAACAAAGFTPRGGLRVAEWTGKFGFVAAGLGVTLVPELAARGVPPSIVLRPLRGTAPARKVYAVVPANPLPAALEFLRLLGQWEPCTTPSPT